MIFLADLSEVTDLLVSHFNENLNDEVDRLGRVAVNLHKKKEKVDKMTPAGILVLSIKHDCAHLHEADAAGQEVHEEGEERGNVVDLRGLGDATQSLQRSHDFLLDRFLLADLSKILLVDEVEEALLERMKHLEGEETSAPSQKKTSLSFSRSEENKNKNWAAGVNAAKIRGGVGEERGGMQECV